MIKKWNEYSFRIILQDDSYYLLRLNKKNQEEQRYHLENAYLNPIIHNNDHPDCCFSLTFTHRKSSKFYATNYNQ